MTTPLKASDFSRPRHPLPAPACLARGGRPEACRPILPAPPHVFFTPRCVSLLFAGLPPSLRRFGAPLSLSTRLTLWPSPAYHDDTGGDWLPVHGERPGTGPSDLPASRRFHQTSLHRKEAKQAMPSYRAGYFTLFHAITQALEQMAHGHCEQAADLLRLAQQTAEETFLRDGD